MLFGLGVILCHGLLADVMFYVPNGLQSLLGADDGSASTTSLRLDDGSVFALTFGVGIVLAGSFIYCLWFLAELFGLTNARHVTASFTFGDKVIAGLAMVETMLFITTLVATYLQQGISDQGSSDFSPVFSISLFLMVGGWIIYFLKRPDRRPDIFGWLAEFGWGKADLGVINLAAVVMILIASVIRLFGAEAFSDSVIAIGLLAIASGIAPHVIYRHRP